MGRALLLLVVVSGCFAFEDDGRHPHPPPDSGPGHGAFPAVCEGRCIVSEPINGYEDCCDSVTCYQDPRSGEWQVVYCDPPPPAPCDACTADELCVVLYDGVCQGIPRCVPKTVECPDNACTPECQTAYCGEDSPYQCAYRPLCGDEPAGAFTCYGP